MFSQFFTPLLFYSAYLMVHITLQCKPSSKQMKSSGKTSYFNEKNATNQTTNQEWKKIDFCLSGMDFWWITI